MKLVTASAVVVTLLAWAGPKAAAQTAAPTAGQAAPSEAATPSAQAPAKPVPGTKPPAPPREAGRPHAFEVSASVLWFAPSSLGTRNANLTANNSSGRPYAWFTATGAFESAVGVEARAIYRLTRRVAIEGGVTYSRPSITYTISNDAEGAPGVTEPGETMSQLFVDASVVAFLSQGGLAGGRLMPFVEAGGGFLSQLHGQEGALSDYYSSDSGQVFHVGGGARYSLGRTRSGAVTGYGLRFDARYYVRNGGFSFDGGRTGTFVAGGGLVVSF